MRTRKRLKRSLHFELRLRVNWDATLRSDASDLKLLLPNTRRLRMVTLPCTGRKTSARPAAFRACSATSWVVSDGWPRQLPLVPVLVMTYPVYGHRAADVHGCLCSGVTAEVNHQLLGLVMPSNRFLPNNNNQSRTAVNLESPIDLAGTLRTISEAKMSDS